jgi:hypothetical protein
MREGIKFKEAATTFTRKQAIKKIFLSTSLKLHTVSPGT